MAQFANDDIMDAALNLIKTNCDKMVACSAQPTTYAEANATYALADVAMTSTDFTGPANGDTSGRKITVASKSGVTVDTSGTATHVALLDTVNERLLYVTTCPSQAVASGGTVSFGAWAIEIADPS
jgi:hypothetical protein